MGEGVDSGARGQIGWGVNRQPGIVEHQSRPDSGIPDDLLATMDDIGRTEDGCDFRSRVCGRDRRDQPTSIARRGSSRQAGDGRLRGPDRTPSAQTDEHVRVQRVRFVRDLLRGLDRNVRARPRKHSDHDWPECVADRLPDASEGEARARDDVRSRPPESAELGGDLLDASGGEHDQRLAVLARHARKICTRSSTHRQAW